MNVGGSRRQLVGHPRQRQIVGRDETQSASIEQTPHHGFGSDGTVPGVGSLEHLVHQEQQSGFPVRQIHDRLQSTNLCIET